MLEVEDTHLDHFQALIFGFARAVVPIDKQRGVEMDGRWTTDSTGNPRRANTFPYLLTCPSQSHSLLPSQCLVIVSVRESERERASDDRLRQAVTL